MATGNDKDTLKVTMGDINQVTEELTSDELKLLYDNLGIDPVKVDHVEVSMASAGTHDTILKARRVLRELWLQEKGSGATREDLFGERDKILKRRKTGKTEAYTEEFNLKECQDQLKEVYLGSDMNVQLTPWDPEHAVEMETIFVNLELVKDEVFPSQTEQIPLQKNEDLLSLKTSTDRRVNRILIQGEPGSGKSTLLNNIAYKWALNLQSTDSLLNSDSPLLQFDLVFFISVHEIVDKYDGLEDIIFNQILEESQTVSKSSLKSYLKSNSQRCLFLIDGIDEDSVGILNRLTNEVSCLLYKKLLKQSCVIASIRPYKLQDVGKNQRHFTKVKLTGFSDENVEEYLRKYFAGKEVDYTALLQRLKEELNVWSMAGTPLLLLFFCILWNDPLQARKSLPNTKTKLYHETIESLWKRYHYEREDFSEEDIATDEFKSKLMSFLETLGEVTLKSLEGLTEQGQDQVLSKLLFTDNDFDETTLSVGLRVGLLSKEKIKSKGSKTLVKFVHTSFHDFCSAVKLAKLLGNNNEKFKECITKLMRAPFTLSGEMAEEVLHFCAGCMPETVKLIAHQLIAIKDSMPRYPPGMEFPIENGCLNMCTLFELAFEAQLTYGECIELVSILSTAGCRLGYAWLCVQSGKPIQYQLDLIATDTNTNNGLMFSTITSFTLCDAVEFTRLYSLFVSMFRYTKQMQYIDVEFSKAPDQVLDLSELFDVLVHLTDLQYLKLYNTSYKTTDKVHVSNIHKICHIKLETLQFINITINVASMTQFLDQNISLKWLAIFSPAALGICTDYDTFSMIKAISKQKQYSSLIFGGIVFGRAIKHLEFIIPQLTRFTLYDPCLDEWDVYKLSSYLMMAETLQTLHLVKVPFGIAISSLADRLKYMINLRDLKLVECGLGNRASYILTDVIKEMRTLHKLDLKQNPDIGLEGRRAIKTLHVHPHFQELEIKLDPMPWEATLADLSLAAVAEYEDTENIHAPVQPISSEQKLTEFLTGNESQLDFEQITVLATWRTYLELEEIQKSQISVLPDCCSCMSQIYNGVT